MSRPLNPRLSTPDTRSRLNTAAQQIIANASLRHEDPAEARQDELDKKNSTIAALQRNFEGLSNMCKEERAKANEWKRMHEETVKAGEGVKRKLGDCEGRLRAALEQVERLTQEKNGLGKVVEENIKLKTEWAGMKSNWNKAVQEGIDKERTLDRLKIELEKASQANALLQLECSRLKSFNSDSDLRVQEAQQLCAAAQAATAVLESSLAQTQAQLSAALHTLSDYESVSNESARHFETLKRELCASEEERKAWEQRHSALAAELASLTRETGALRSSIIDFERAAKARNEAESNEKAQMSESLAKARAEAKALRGKVVELEGEKHSLEVDLAEARSCADQGAALALKLREQDTLLRDYTALSQHQLLQLQQASASALSLETQLKSADFEAKTSREALERARRELEACNTELHVTRTQLETAEANGRAKEAELSEALKAKTQENRELLAELKAKSALGQTLVGLLEGKNKESEAKDRQVRDLEEQLSVSESQLRNTEEKLRAALAANTQAELLSQLQSVTSEFEAFKKTTKEEVKGMAKASETLKTRIAELQTSLAASAKEAARYKQLSESAQARSDVELAEVESAKAALQTLSIDFAQLRSQNKLLEEKVKIADFALTEAREQLVKGQQQAESDRLSLQAIRAQFSGQSDRMHQLEQQLDQARNSSSRQQLSKAVEDIGHAIYALESNLTCSSCLEVLSDAVVCVPCGHNYCRSCQDGYTPHCQQCGNSAAVKYTMKNAVVNEAASKVTFVKQVLQAAKRAIA